MSENLKEMLKDSAILVSQNVANNFEVVKIEKPNPIKITNLYFGMPDNFSNEEKKEMMNECIQEFRKLAKITNDFTQNLSAENKKFFITLAMTYVKLQDFGEYLDFKQSEERKNKQDALLLNKEIENLEFIIKGENLNEKQQIIKGVFDEMMRRLK